MGQIIIEIEGNTNLKIKARNIEEAINKLKQKEKLNRLEKFKGIGKKDYSLEKHKEDWYKQ